MTDANEKTLDDCNSVEEIAEYHTPPNTEHHLCIDCGVNTLPGAKTKQETAEDVWKARQEGREWGDSITYDENTEVYIVRDRIWQEAGREGAATAPQGLSPQPHLQPDARD